MPLLASIRSSYVPMAPLTAIAFLCLGGVLLVHSMGLSQGPVAILTAMVSALFSAYGLVEFVEYLGIPVLAMEEWLFPNPPMSGAIPAGRMSPTTAALLLLSGAVAPMLFLRERGWERRKLFGDMAGCLGVLVAMGGTVFILSYLHGAPFLYGTAIIPMAATTAIAFLLLGTGQILAVGPDSFPLRLIVGPSARARLLRVFVSTAIGIVVAIDLMHVYAHGIFFEDNAFMSGVSATAVAVITAALIARIALKVGDDMDRSEKVRRDAEDKLRESEDRFRDLVEHSQELVCTHDLEGRLLSVNPWTAKILGYSQDELLRMKMRDFLAPEVRNEFDAYLEKIRKHGAAQGMLLVQTRDGERRIWEYKNTLRTEGVAEPIVRGMAQDITERKRSEKRLVRLYQQNELILSSAAEGILGLDLKGRHTFVNPAASRMLGYEVKELLGRPSHGIWHHTKPDGSPYPEEECHIYATFRKGVVHRVSTEVFWSKDGTSFPVEYVSTPIYEQGRVAGAVLSFTDITERKRAEEDRRKLERQLQTAQKMESVGTLAGGIAHDFNNALTVILGFGEMLKLRIANDPKAVSDLDEILRSAERASVLTRQILTFARRQIVEFCNLDLNQAVIDLEKLLRKVARENIEIRTFLAEGLPTIRADQGQVEQVLMNLSINARDAMPEGGQLSIETHDEWLNEEHVKQYPYMKPGRYVVLSLSDTGTGMDEGTRERIFEPFFTTKGPDKGTGLGLAMVYGIVKQHNGFVHVYSEPGMGTTFRIYFPTVDAPVEAKVIESRGIIRGGSETILLAEDDDSIRSLTEKTLSSNGYRTLVACNGVEAVDIFHRHRDEIAIAVLDVVMPKMGGKQAYDEMAAAVPGLKVLFLSGYSVNAIHDSFVLHPGIPFLQKPFGPSALARKVREVLDRK